MSGSTAFPRQSQQALDEHRQIHFYLDQISRSLEGFRSGLTDVEPMRRLAAQLHGLEERLVEHHHAEEHGGLFTSLREAMPDCGPRVDRLIAEHGRMIEILEMARIHAQCGEPGDADALRVDLESFVEQFRSHERDEEELIRRAIEREER